MNPGRISAGSPDQDWPCLEKSDTSVLSRDAGASVALKRVLLDAPAFFDRVSGHGLSEDDVWRQSWVRCSDLPLPPFVTAYRLRFELPQAKRLRCHVSADERYELFLDGMRVGRGPERGDKLHWFYETYQGDLAAGPHVIVARVWSLGPSAPRAQVSLRPAFLLASDSDELAGLIDTGHAPWEARVLPGYSFQSPLAAWGTGANLVVEGSAFAWDFQKGGGDGWKPVEVVAPANGNPRTSVGVLDPVLTPARIPPMIDIPVSGARVRHVAKILEGDVSKYPILASEHRADEAAAWQSLFDGTGRVTLPPHSRRRIIVDLEDYFCAYQHVAVSGGAGGHLDVHWQETLFEGADARNKGNRDEIEGKFYTTIWHLKDGIGDHFEPDGGENRPFESLWWHCGRYLQILVGTAESPLVVEAFELQETRYPLELVGEFQSSSRALNEIAPLAWRTLQMCAHETYFDCPYFEQLQYVGDARIECLVTYVAGSDNRLASKAIQAFDWSRSSEGMTQSHYPAGIRQVIPPFSLLWIGMVHDWFLWCDDFALVRERLPGVRAVLDYWLSRVTPHASIEGVCGWNYLDWVPAWKSGTPPDGAEGGGAAFSFLLQWALRQAAELEEFFGEPELAARWRRRSRELAAGAHRLFWDDTRGLYADDEGHNSFSEHAQSLAILAGTVDEAMIGRVARGLLEATDLTRTTIYFSHYLFEAYRLLGRTDALVDRLSLWTDLRARGLRTTIEMPEPTRSDCHAWASHPLYHFLATLLGIRPARPGFAAVEIAPQPGPLASLSGAIMHPLGRISVEIENRTSGIKAVVTLPGGLEGGFRHGPHMLDLRSGRQEIELPRARAAISGTP